ncbi:MAG: tripartite tricarboxylate transporter substrate binding protein [Burkholderiaceae bacterium]|nr:tripartite tricarboxylate transporter substrate binding protein [Burkholderiaceae bacterium]
MTHPHLSRRHLLAATAAGLSLPCAWAQPGFPVRPLTWVVPYPTGGFGDSMSRLLTQKLGERLKQTVIVENRPGGAAQIAANAVKLQPADGHTLLYGDIGPFAMYPSLYPKLSFEPLKDFVPLTRLFKSPTLLVVPASSPLRSFADLQRAASRDPGLQYGSYGIGSQPHVWCEMLRLRSGLRISHVPYQGAGPALQDLIGGRLDFMVDVIASSLPLVRDGKLRALALIGAERRASALPEVPTISELGLAALDIPGWNGVMLRAGTPPAAVEALHAATVAALQSPEVLQRYTALGLEPAPLAPAAFGDFIRSETSRWGAAIREAGIKVE